MIQDYFNRKERNSLVISNLSVFVALLLWCRAHCRPVSGWFFRRRHIRFCFTAECAQERRRPKSRAKPQSGDTQWWPSTSGPEHETSVRHSQIRKQARTSKTRSRSAVATRALARVLSTTFHPSSQQEQNVVRRQALMAGCRSEAQCRKMSSFYEGRSPRNEGHQPELLLESAAPAIQASSFHTTMRDARQAKSPRRVVEPKRTADRSQAVEWDRTTVRKQ